MSDAAVSPAINELEAALATPFLKCLLRLVGGQDTYGAWKIWVASHSIRRVTVTTVACSLLLQVGYFGSVLFLMAVRPRTQNWGKRLSISAVTRKLDTSRQTMVR
nr:exopolysaccharide production repressor protein [Mesorhizobium hawassense]